MPSFDVVSKLDLAEVDNAINGSMREISNRYDFKNSKSHVTREEKTILLIAEDNYKIDHIQQIFRTHLVKRGLSSGYFDFSKIEEARGGLLKQSSKISEEIDRDLSQKINKTIKNSKIKVQVSIEEMNLGLVVIKDLLQSTIAIIKEMNLKQPLQFINFRD